MLTFIDACQKVVELNDELEVPRQAWMECCRHLGVDVPKEALKEDAMGAIGYRRGLIHFPIATGWSVCLPGDFSQDLMGQNIWRGWVEDREVKIQIYPLTRNGAVEDILPRLTQEPLGQRMTAKSAEIDYHAVGDLYMGEDDRLYFEAECLCRDSILALVASAPEGEENWMKGVWETIRRE